MSNKCENQRKLLKKYKPPTGNRKNIRLNSIERYVKCYEECKLLV